MSWNDERVETLKKLWADGLSASKIANRIGGVTRNAVISKIHRLGLSGRGAAGGQTSAASRARARQTFKFGQRGAPPPAQKVRRSAAIAFEPDPEPFATYEDLDIPPAERKSLLDLERDDCRWPIGDPQHAGFHFCNRSKVPGLPYCEFHARRAYQPVKPQTRSKPAVPAHSAVERETVDA